MFETIGRKPSKREWLGMILGLQAPVPGWEIALRLLAVAFAVMVMSALGGYLFLGRSVLSPWLVLFLLAASVGIGTGLQVKHSGGRASRRQH
jgi:hypothetical protein